MLGYRLALALGAMQLALAGCTITTYSSTAPPPPPRRHPARLRPAAPPPPPARPTWSAPPRRAPPPTRATPRTTATAPAITAPIPFGNGKRGTFKGLAYVIPAGTTSMPSFDGLVPFATLYTDAFDVAPQPFDGDFPGALLQQDAFGIRYEGDLALPRDGTYTFRLVADDGAIVWLDGTKLLDDDGVHGPKAVGAMRRLSAGRHHLRLDYFQERRGDVALQLDYAASSDPRPSRAASR
jgi:hypothetical protein